MAVEQSETLEMPSALTGRAADALCPVPAGTAICVDLDGTLVKSDTLLDTVLALARQHPGDLVKIPGWIGQGKAAFKRHLTARVKLDVEHLPYNRARDVYKRQH